MIAEAAELRIRAAMVVARDPADEEPGMTHVFKKSCELCEVILPPWAERVKVYTGKDCTVVEVY